MKDTLSTCAFELCIDFVATSNAPVVQRLLDAGAVVLGKTNLPVAAADVQTYNDKYGTTNNPWDPTRGAGGSSGWGNGLNSCTHVNVAITSVQREIGMPGSPVSRQCAYISGSSPSERRIQ